MCGSKRTLLLVDDDQSILRVLRRIFEKKGYAVTSVGTGKDAFFQIAHNCFDASVVDVRLPDMNGFDIARKIGELSPKTVRVVFTGSMEASSYLDGPPIDLDAFLLKPVNPETLLNIIDETIKSRSK